MTSAPKLLGGLILMRLILMRSLGEVLFYVCGMETWLIHSEVWVLVPRNCGSNPRPTSI